jgi:hypothetical protein
LEKKEASLNISVMHRKYEQRYVWFVELICGNKAGTDNIKHA